MLHLSKKTQNFAHQHNLFWKGQKIVVGISGGADSVCLLDVLMELKKKYDFSLQLAHINYNLRGKDSLKDQVFVEKIAKERGLEISVLSCKKMVKVSDLENNLRKVRYDFFEKERARLKFDSIAVAHNQDDQAETVLLHIMRGAGLQGLSSMKPRNDRIIRPLLDISREEILKHLEEKNLKFRLDKTNFKPVFFRNKIRLKLIPYLEKNFSPSIKKTLARLAETTSFDYEYISKEAEKKFKFRKVGLNKIEFSSDLARSLHQAAFREGLRAAILALRSELVNLELAHIIEIEKIVKSQKGKNQKTSFKGLKIEKRGAIVSILCEK